VQREVKGVGVLYLAAIMYTSKVLEDIVMLIAD
jgi:hypothetical protein